MEDYSKNIIKSLATAIGANLAAGAISSVVVSSVLSFVPGLGNIAASALMAGVAFSLTWSCGLVYLKVLTRFAEANVDLGKVGEEDLKAIADKMEELTESNSQISVPRWFLKSVENTLRIQHNINLSRPDCCQSRNVKGALNGVRKLLKGEELTGMERLEPLVKD